MTKKDIRVNKMWYTMWWQYAWITIGIVAIVISLLLSLFFKDASYIFYGITIFVPELIMHKATFSAGNYYRERHPRYEE